MNLLKNVIRLSGLDFVHIICNRNDTTVCYVLVKILQKFQQLTQKVQTHHEFWTPHVCFIIDLLYSAKEFKDLEKERKLEKVLEL